MQRVQPRRVVDTAGVTLLGVEVVPAVAFVVPTCVQWFVLFLIDIGRPDEVDVVVGDVLLHVLSRGLVR